jgi:hypothetical protein
VEWFSRDGESMFEIDGVGTGAGFLSKLIAAPESTDSAAEGNRRSTIIGLDPYWELELPDKRDRDCFICATPTSHVFLHLFHPSEGQVAVDVYRAGVLTETVGPFSETGSSRVKLAPSGAFAITLDSYEQGAATGVIVVDPKGHQSERMSIDGHGALLHTDPLGRGVLYQAEDRNKYWAEPGQTPVRLDVWGGNSHVMAWAPTQALFHEWSEDGMRFSLVDLPSGKSVWRKPAMDWLQRHGSAVLDHDWIYLYEWELADERGRGGGHTITVLDLKSGDSLHVWKSSRTSGRLSPPSTHARLLAVRGEIYFMTDFEFARIDRADVESHRGGWTDLDKPTR